MTKRPRKDKTTRVAQMAAPVRRAISDLLADRLRSETSKKRLADEIGQSVHTINGMIYQGDGGFDSLIAALLVAYQVEPDILADIIRNYPKYVRSEESICEADRAWQQLDQYFSPDDKLFLVNLIRTSIDLHRSLNDTKREPKRVTTDS